MWPITDSSAHKIYAELYFCKWHAFFNLIAFTVFWLAEWVALQITPLLKPELLFSFILDGFQDTTYQNDRGLELCIASLFLWLIFLVFTFCPWMSYAWETWETHFKAYSKSSLQGCVWAWLEGVRLSHHSDAIWAAGSVLPSEIRLNDCAMEIQAWIFDQLKPGTNPYGLV